MHDDARGALFVGEQRFELTQTLVLARPLCLFFPEAADQTVALTTKRRELLLDRSTVPVEFEQTLVAGACRVLCA